MINHAEAAGNRVLALRTRPLLAFLAQKGPAPVPTALETCAAIMEQVADDQESRAMTQLELATLAAMAGELTRAHTYYVDHALDAGRTRLGDAGGARVAQRRPDRVARRRAGAR